MRQPNPRSAELGAAEGNDVAKSAAEAPPWHARSADDVLTALESRPEGLSEDEATRRLEQFGPNRLQTAQPVAAWAILSAQLRSVVVLLLFVAAGVALVMRQPLEAAAIFAVLLLNTLLGFFTELRARRAMEGLLGLEVSRATVLRDDVARDIEAMAVVPGDVLVVEAGQSVAADARLLSATNLRADEAALTGESVPVDKTTDELAEETGLADRTNMIYKGTAVVAGAAHAAVVSTGMQTEVGRIGRIVGGLGEEKTPLEVRLDALGRRLVWITLLVALIVAATGVLRGFELVRMLETGIALAIAAVPEGLPAVATIALGVGLRRMARRRALIRRLPAVEALGSATVICTDKTGTLTAGEMTVVRMIVADRVYEVTGIGYAPDGEIQLNGQRTDAQADAELGVALRIAALANRSGVEEHDGDWIARGDPTEAALLVAAAKAGVGRDALLEEWPEEGEVPFSSERKLMATFNRSPDGDLVAHVKGAPGVLDDFCAQRLTAEGERALDDAGRTKIEENNRQLAADGLRVLALACRAVDTPDDEQLRDLLFVGLAGMIDPPAEGVRETIARFHDAGIRVLMVTGDQKLTAEAVGRELGVLEEGHEVLDGKELARLSDEDLAQRVQQIAAFTRVSPEDKLRIIAALQAHGEIVAMLGDGVNDAAALKKASIGVAMGVRGTDVAKDASDVILQDDRFQTISAAVEEGRVIYDNIRKFVFYLFSCNLAEVLVLFIASVSGLPLPLLPLQILWLNLVTDTLPALALALEPADADVMRRPPRNPETTLLSRHALAGIAAYAALITASTLAAFLWGLRTADDPRRAVTLCFITLGLSQIFHLGNARSREVVLSRRSAFSNRYAVGAVAITVALQVLAIHFAPLASILRTYSLRPSEWGVAVALSLVPAVAGQIVKFVRARRS
jgi:Ca2+-transporting ATPase